METEKPAYWQSSSTSPSSSSSSDSFSHISYFTLLEENINSKAKKLTLDYLKRGGDRRGGQQQSLQDQVFLVYKFIHTPVDAIIAGM